MAASAKTDRDNAASVLRLALRRLDSLTRKKQIQMAIRTAEQLYAEAIRLHILYCSKMGEDQNAGSYNKEQDVPMCPISPGMSHKPNKPEIIYLYAKES